MRFFEKFLFSAIILLHTAYLLGQATNTANTLVLDAGSDSPPATLEDAAWLVGDWFGEALGGRFEESWNPPSGGTMLGMFKLVSEGKTVFSEHMSIIESQGSLVLRLKHFDGNLVGWEEKDKFVEFPLVKVSATELYFSGLTFRGSPGGKLDIFVASKSDNGKVDELLFSASLSRPGQSDSARKDAFLVEIDSYIQKVQQDWQVPGLAVAIVQGDQILMSKGYGVRDIRGQDPVNSDTLFAIASNSKAFTAAALAILVDEGKLSWDDPVYKYLPKFQMPEAWTSRELTVRDLLCHRSGMDTFSGDLLWYDTNYSAEEIVQRVRYLKPVSSFRSRYGYQNLMYIAAGLVIREVSGKSWAEFVSERILAPLNMQRTTTSISQIQENFAAPHNRSGGDTLRALPLGDVDNSWGACGLNSSVNDLAKWMQMQLAGGKHNQQQIIAEKQLHEMWQPWMVLQQPFEATRQPYRNFSVYGLGYFLMDWNGYKVVHHSGGLDGMISQLAMVPELNLGVVVLTNSESSASAFIRNRVLECFLGITDRSDRSGEALQKHQEAELKKSQALAKEDSERRLDTQPTVPLDQLSCRFRSQLYGDVLVELVGDKLVLKMEPAPNFVADLEHWQFNTFLIRWRDSVKYDFPRGFATFTIDAKGKPERLILDQPNNDFWFYELELFRVPDK